MTSRTLATMLIVLGAFAFAGQPFAQVGGGLTPPLRPVAAPPAPPPPIAEDFGLRPFAFSPAELASGHSAEINSVREARVWAALMALLSSKSGFHTRGEVEKALGVKMILSRGPQERGETGFWKAATGNVDLIYFGTDETSRTGTYANLRASWSGPLQPASCIPAQRALADVQMAAGRGFFQMHTVRRFRLDFGEEVEIASDTLPKGCVSNFMLVSMPFQHSKNH
jgi:hypothetical protein